MVWFGDTYYGAYNSASNLNRISWKEFPESDQITISVNHRGQNAIFRANVGDWGVKST